jgi:hypothetical protein
LPVLELEKFPAVRLFYEKLIPLNPSRTRSVSLRKKHHNPDSQATRKAAKMFHHRFRSEKTRNTAIWPVFPLFYEGLPVSKTSKGMLELTTARSLVGQMALKLHVKEAVKD